MFFHPRGGGGRVEEGMRLYMHQALGQYKATGLPKIVRIMNIQLRHTTDTNLGTRSAA